MPGRSLSSRNIVIGLALTAIVGIVLTLAVGAQEPDDIEPGRTSEKVTEVEEIELIADPEATTQFPFFKSISANTFVPFDDDMDYQYDGGGCVYRFDGSRFANHTLQLPQGAEIDFLRIYFYDNDPSYDVMAYIYAYDGSGGYTVIAQAQSSGTPGWSSAGSIDFSHLVDNSAEFLAVVLDYGLGGNKDAKICGVRIRYQYSISTLSLPVVLNQTNP